jgi:hypothetical protein
MPEENENSHDTSDDSSEDEKDTSEEEEESSDDDGEEGGDEKGDNEGDSDDDDDDDGKEGKDKDGDDDEEEGEEEEEEDQEPEVRNKEEEKDDGKGDEDEDDLDPDDKKTINKIIDKKLSPLQQKIQRQNDEIDVNSYIVDNPEYAKYKPTMLKYLAHPAYKNIPVKNIASIVAGNDLQKLGAKKEREAAKKAKATRSKESSGRKAGGGKVDWLKASDKEYEKKLQEVRGMRR